MHITTTEKRNGYLELSTVKDNQLVRRQYEGYTKAEAKKLFKAEVTRLNDNIFTNQNKG